MKTKIILLAFALSPMLSQACNGLRQAERLRCIDADGDGAISRAEARGHPALADDFDSIDANGDGRITPDELRAWKKAKGEARGRRGAARLEEYFNRADRDGDGVLTRAEAALAMPRLAGHFDAMDADRDGRLTLVELRAYLQKKRDLRRAKF